MFEFTISPRCSRYKKMWGPARIKPTVSASLFCAGANFAGKCLRGVLSCVSSNKVKTKLISLKHSNLFCREGWGGFNVPGARNEYNALNPHCLNSIYASEGRNTLLKSLLFRVVGAATGKGGWGLRWCRCSRVWGSQACSHVACTVLGLLMAPTRGMLSIFCNCFSISFEFFVFTTFGGAWLTRCSYVGCS